MYLIRSGAVGGYEKLIAELGGNPVALLAKVGLTPAQLHNPNTYVSYRSLSDLLEYSAADLACDSLGAMLAARQDSSVLGDMVMSAFHQPTLQHALDSVNKHLYLHARGVRLVQETHGQACLLTLEFDVQSELGMNQLLQLSVGQLNNFINEALGLGSPRFPILLRQPRPRDAPSRLSQELVGRMEFDTAVDGVRLAGAWLNYQPRFDEAAVEQHLQDYLDSLRQQYPDSLRDQVRELISQFLPSNECSLERVAASLDLHPRVLQQRLRQHDSGYGELLREVRCTLAQQHLRYAATSVTELALQLGYAEVSVFSRSFRQWTGMSPREWQQRHAS